jgi:5-methylcytosine-specific restriction endonuclease McrA
VGRGAGIGTTMKKKQTEHEPEYIALEKKLNASQKETYELAIKQGYLKQKGNKGDKIRAAFYHWCEAFDRPYIIIDEGKVTSLIHIDFPPGFKHLSDATLEQLWEIVIRYCDPFEENYVTYVRHVPNDESEQVAQEIIELIDESPDDPIAYSSDSVNRKVEQMLLEKVKQHKGRLNSSSRSRDKDIVTVAKDKAGGVCQLCNKKAPFKDRLGRPYLEVHHVRWISRGGEDVAENVVALCPNCHKKMHVLDLPDDRTYLLKKAQSPF